MASDGLTDNRDDDKSIIAADARFDQSVEAAKELLVDMLRSMPNGESVRRLQEIVNNPDDPAHARKWRDPVVQKMVAIFASIGLQLVVGRTLGRNL